MAKKKQNTAKPELEPEKLEFSTDPEIRQAQIDKWAEDFVKEHEEEINALLGLNPDGTLKSNEEPKKEEKHEEENGTALDA